MIKNRQIPLVMQEETKLGKYNYFYKGHRHEKHTEKLGNVIIQQVASPAHPSDWELVQGFSTRGKIDGQLFTKKDGKIGEFSV